MRKMSAMEKNRLIILFLVSLLLGTCTDAWEEHTRINDNVSQETILDYLEAHSEFSQFTGLLKSVGMEGNFSYPGLFTLYAPTNSAMEKVSAGMIDSDEKKKLFVSFGCQNSIHIRLLDAAAISTSSQSFSHISRNTCDIPNVIASAPPISFRPSM